MKTSNVDDAIRGAGIEGEIDVLSIDIDGNDYWIWEAIEAVDPRIVVIETHAEYGLEDVLAPYDEDLVWANAEPGAPFGASPGAMTALAERLGYRLVGANRRGFNAFYLRNDLAPELPRIEVAELVGSPCLAFADALHLGRVQRIDLRPALPLLLTATVTPPAGMPFLTRSDPQVRLGDYADALRTYLQLPDGVVDRIVVADNSNSDLSALEQVVAASSSAKDVELLPFPGREYPVVAPK